MHWTTDRFTCTYSIPSEVPTPFFINRQASSKTYLPILSILPFSSAIGINSCGGINPSFSSLSLTRASQETILFLELEYIG